jgi:hypothetical protein
VAVLSGKDAERAKAALIQVELCGTNLRAAETLAGNSTSTEKNRYYRRQGRSYWKSRTRRYIHAMLARVLEGEEALCGEDHRPVALREAPPPGPGRSSAIVLLWRRRMNNEPGDATYPGPDFATNVPAAIDFARDESDGAANGRETRAVEQHYTSGGAAEGGVKQNFQFRSKRPAQGRMIRV